MSLKPLTPNQVIDTMSAMRDAFPVQDSLSRALDGDADPTLLLARTARNEAHQEVLEAYEGMLSELTGISRDAVTPAPQPEPEMPRRQDFSSYLSEL